jgi:hypothetical protein
MSNFCPYVLKETIENRPSSLSAAAWSGNQHRYLALTPGTTEENFTEVQEIVRASHAASNGICFNYGPIVGYRVVFSPTESVLLDTSAQVLTRKLNRKRTVERC